MHTVLRMHKYMYKADAMCLCIFIRTKYTTAGAIGGGSSGTRLIWTVGFCLSVNKIWLPSVWITRNFELIHDTSIIIGPYNPF